MKNLSFEKFLNFIKQASRQKIWIFTFLAVVGFFVLNAVKVALFNYYLLPAQTTDIFKYKLKITILVLIVVYFIIFSIKSRAVFIIFYLLQLLYIIVNISYYSYYHSYLHIWQWITLFKEGLISAEHSSVPRHASLYTAFIDLPFAVLIALGYSRVLSLSRKLKPLKLSLVALSVLFLMFFEFQNYSQGLSFIHFTQNRYLGESPIVEKYGTAVNNAVSLYLNSSEEDLIADLRYGREQTGTSKTGDRPNFLLIQVESLDSNAIMQKYKGEYIAPYLHSLTEKSVYFPYLMSYHKGGSTSDTEFAAISSVEPFDGFPAMKLSNYIYPNSFIPRLTGSSYSSVAFHGNTGNFFNRDVAYPKMGFQKFFDMEAMNLFHVGWGAPDKDVFDFAANHLATAKKPFFSYVVTMTGHGPFTNANNYYHNPLYDDMEEENARNYFNSVSYEDQVIKEFVEEVRSRYPNTYIFIYGDHCPNMITSVYKQASFTLGDSMFEFVPLFIVTPDNQVHKEDSKVACALDFSPTVLYASGIKFSILSDGSNLLSPESITGKVPFKGKEYEREFLFDQISQTSP